MLRNSIDSAVKIVVVIKLPFPQSFLSVFEIKVKEQSRQQIRITLNLKAKHEKRNQFEEQLLQIDK